MRALSTFLTARVGFWRALAEITLLIQALVLIGTIPAVSSLAGPVYDLLSYVTLVVYILPAWRLAPGAGGLLRRGLRLLAWVLIFALVNSVLGWLAIRYLPLRTEVLGIDFSELNLGLGAYVFSSVVITLSCVLPARLLMNIWRLGRTRLRWRLTFTHLLVGILTLFIVPLTLLIYVAVLSLSAVPALLLPRELAPRMVAALEPSVAAGASPAQLDAVLAGILDGSTSLPLPDDPDLANEAFSDLTLTGLRSLSIISPDGEVLASAGPQALAVGQPLSPGDEGRLRLMIDQARAGTACRDGVPAGATITDTVACPLGGPGGPILVVESAIDSSAQLGAAFGRIVAVTLLGSSLTLNVTIFVVIFLLPIGIGAGYLLARGPTRRLEQLAAAAGDLAAGDLSRRVALDSQDEIGRLADTFNSMAAQLAERERALASSAARAEELLSSNRRLVADVSHELRNPLATLRGYLEALEQSHGDQLPAHDMQVIQREMQRLTGLVDDLFTLARAEARQLPLHITEVDVGAMARRLVEAQAPLARRERQIELVAQLEPGLPQAHADIDRLEQVLRNLLQNALRHTPAGGIIAVEARRGEGGAVCLSVADTGVGIAPEDLPHIFERFYRGDSSRARETGGAGLGLSLVHELVAAMGGEVAAASEPGRGSRFTVLLRAAG